MTTYVAIPSRGFTWFELNNVYVDGWDADYFTVAIPSRGFTWFERDERKAGEWCGCVVAIPSRGFTWFELRYRVRRASTR